MCGRRMIGLFFTGANIEGKSSTAAVPVLLLFQGHHTRFKFIWIYKPWNYEWNTVIFIAATYGI